MFKARNFLISALLFLLIAIVSMYFNDMKSSLSIGSRWISVFFFSIYGFKQKNLTAWIFISMVIGVFVGIDFPEVAENSKVLSSIFLKMIKTVIAPLLFGTLVVGIAGHANLKQIGRMGIKSLIYFEIVTTIALFIGLAAINISK
jgi:proton glutamate symport protein